MEPSAAAGAEAGAEPEVSGAVETGAEEPLPQLTERQRQAMTAAITSGAGYPATS